MKEWRRSGYNDQAVVEMTLPPWDIILESSKSDKISWCDERFCKIRIILTTFILQLFSSSVFSLLGGRVDCVTWVKSLSQVSLDPHSSDSLWKQLTRSCLQDVARSSKLINSCLLYIMASSNWRHLWKEKIYMFLYHKKIR